MQIAIESLCVCVLILVGISAAILIRNLWLDMRARELMNDAVNLYLDVTKLKHRAALDDLAKEDDGR